jgi:hypothetical protein
MQTACALALSPMKVGWSARDSISAIVTNDPLV